jgi:hypothetical protein
VTVTNTIANQPTTATENDSIIIEPDVMGDCLSDLELYVHLLRNELNDDFSENCRTHRLTDKQKQLLPLFTQMISAHSTYMLQELVDFADTIASRR